MEPYSNVLCHTIISDQKKGYIEIAADLFFLPVLYFSGGKGRLYSIIDKKVSEDTAFFPQVHHESRWGQGLEYLLTAIAIVTYIPGIILGYIAKSFAMRLDPAIGERQQIVADYIGKVSDEETITIETVEITVEIPKVESETLDEIDKKRRAAANAIRKKLEDNALKDDFHTISENQASYNSQAAKLWETTEMIQLVDDFMEVMVQEIQIFMKELRKEGNGEMAEIVRLLENQRGKPVNGKYCWKFFNMTQMYHMIRSMQYWCPHPATAGFYPFSALEYFDSDARKIVINTELETPFFKEGTKQYKWRQYYNYFCNQFRDIFPHMSDSRFQNWAKPDVQKGVFRGRPDTIPT
ncbi:hypothetical protein [Simkania sp.]|uniref:hypothetical protein n=1 Tax=Simkania sp. TaxID=34094 RepID=UPI003B517C68